MSVLLAFPVLIITIILQMVIASRLSLLHGTVDLVLLALIAWALQERARSAWIWALIAGLAVSYISALPLYAPLIAYLIATAIARLLQRRVWQTPILALLVAVVLATVFQNVLSLAVLQFVERPIPIQQGLTLVALPSLLLNLIVAIPVYTVIADLAHWVYPPLED
jgi:rod shape-determining protein MreD